MRKPICEFCGEYTTCVCDFEKCALCGVRYSNFDSDENHQMYEYRGANGCSACIDKVREKRDEQRARVMEVTNHAVASQRKGEFVNNYKKYNIHNVAADGLPIVKINEPQILKDYEDGKL